MTAPLAILFPAAPGTAAEPPAEFQVEVEAARAAGFATCFYGLGPLRVGDTGYALKGCPEATWQSQPILHRGWMLSDTVYERLYVALTVKGYVALVTPGDYSEAHYLPYAYQHLSGWTPETEWIVGRDRKTAWILYQRFRDGDAILKDFVKSAKRRWREACFLPAGAKREEFDAIMSAFVEARGPLFEKGIVIRRYHPLRCIGEDMSGMPLHEEYRLFFWNARLLMSVPFPQEEERDRWLPVWAGIAGRFRTRFLSMDVARQEDGSFIIVEVGDGGVTGLPLSIDPEMFYRLLWQAVTAENEV